MEYYYNIDNNVNIDEAEAEETLSLCDLVTTTHDHNENDAADQWDVFSRVSKTSSSILLSSHDDEQEDLFEFFSEDWSSNSITYPPENIIFCGKQIAYKQQPMSETMEKFESNLTSDTTRGIIRWNSDSFSVHKNPQKNGYKKNRNEKKLHNFSSSSSSSTSSKQTHNKKGFYDLSVHKMSILTSPSKSRWYLLLFGIARVPTRMELRSIKSRQSRQCPSSTPLFQLKDGDDNHDINACSKLSKGLWGVIRAIGCVRHHHATSIKASLRSIPLENSCLN